jgi:hypothetical protein
MTDAQKNSLTILMSCYEIGRIRYYSETEPPEVKVRLLDEHGLTQDVRILTTGVMRFRPREQEFKPILGRMVAG